MSAAPDKQRFGLGLPDQAAVALGARRAETRPASRLGAVRADVFGGIAAGLISVPASPGEWAARWRETNVPGVLLTSLLLSLGAPFWYSALKKMLQLRSVLAAKDDEQRAARQASDKDEPRIRGLLAQVTAQPPPPAPAALPPSPAPPAGP